MEEGEEKVERCARGERVDICSGVLNIKPISSLMKCKYYGESLNWNTERKGAKGGSDSLFQVFTFRLPRLGETSAGREGKKREKVCAEVQTRGQFVPAPVCGPQVSPGAPEDDGLNSNKPKHAALTAALPSSQE